MRNKNKSSSYPEIKTRKRELCAPYKPLATTKERNKNENKFSNIK